MTNATPDSRAHDDDDSMALDARDRDLDALCENWVYWCRERRLYWPAPKEGAEIVRRGGGTRPLRKCGDVSITTASMAAFHIAYTCQPDSLDKQAFDLYYVARVTPVKAAAAALGIGRSHFYRVLVEFRRRLNLAARAFEQNGGQVASLVPIEDPHQPVASHGETPAVNTESVSSLRDKLDH